MADNLYTWPSNNDSFAPCYEPKEYFLEYVSPSKLQCYSGLRMGRHYPHDGSVSISWSPSQRNEMMIHQAAQGDTADLQRETLKQRLVVPKKNAGLYDVVQKAMRKCDYPNCCKAFRRSEHLKRHKQTFHGEGPNRFSCEFCGKDQFNRQDNLNNHRKLHARPNNRKRGVEFIAAAVPVIEQEERSRKRRAPSKSRFFDWNHSS